MSRMVEVGLRQNIDDASLSVDGDLFLFDQVEEEVVDSKSLGEAKKRLDERTYGYNLLFEVNHLRENIKIESDGSVSFLSDAVDYVRCNELTAAMEAVTERFLSVTFQEWDEELGGFRAFSEHETVAAMTRRGFSKMSDESVFRFEKDRRKLEYGEAVLLDSQYKGLLRDHVLLTISPYPDEVPEFIAGAKGYKSETKQAMLRWHELSEKGEKTVYQLNLDNADHSSVEVFSELIRQLGDSDFIGESTLDILASPIFISKDKITNGVIDIARVYDSILEKESTNTKHYFCGRVVANETQKLYNDLAKKSELMVEESSDLMERMVELDMELAESLEKGYTTKMIQSKIEYFFDARNDRDEFLLDEGQRLLLGKYIGVNSNTSFGVDAAKLLKSVETIRAWSILSCRFNREQAEMVFGEERVEQILVAFEDDYTDEDLAWAVLDNVVSQTNDLQFVVCGGSLKSYTGGNFFQSSLSSVEQDLFGSSESSSVMECVKCPFCKKTVDAIVTSTKIKCPECKEEAKKQ